MKTATKTLILRYTATEDLSALELADMLGITKRNVNQNLKQLIESGEIKIVSYRLNSPGHPSPLYSSVKFRRHMEYVTLTPAETSRRHREKFKAVYRAKKGRMIMGVTV